tara:strand:- start:5023 stop:6060 length:1038 start_codon:yes stop_codon:yes gene_type:complete
MQMEKLITLITLALTVGVACAQSNLDSLHTVINNELKQTTTGLENQIQSVSTDLSALSSSKTQQQEELNTLRDETDQFNTSLSTLKEGLTTELNEEVRSLKSTISKETKALHDTITSLRAKISDRLKMIGSEVDELSTTLSTTNNQLGAVKDAGEQNDKSTHEQLTYMLAAICILLLLVIVVYWLTHKKHGNVRSEIGDAKADLEEQINTANADFAEKLAQTLSELPKPDDGGLASQGLILDFAQQIASMENNIWHLPEKDRVRRRIEKSTKSMRDTFKSLGYDMPKLLGTEILDGQALDIRNLNEDPSIEKGKRVVTLVAKPQVLFNGKTIQTPIIDIAENTED